MASESVLNAQTFRATPNWIGDYQRRVVVDAARIAPRMEKKGRKRPVPESYVLLGFDTEYQSIEAVERETIAKGEAKNKVLSYQYWVRIIDRATEGSPAHAADAPQRHFDVGGIIVPDDDQRLLMSEFIVMALGDFLDKNPGVLLPQDVIMVGHFTRADLPAFSDFKDTAKEVWSNVRNTFVSVDQRAGLQICDETGSQIADLQITLRDTLLLAPSNAKSLADIGEIVGFPKIRLGDTPEADLAIKENMEAFRKSDWETFREYAIRDAQVCVLYAEKVIRQYETLFGEFRMPLSLTEFGVKKVLQDWSEEGLKVSDLIGRETISSKKFDKKRAQFRTQHQNVYIAEVYHEDAFVTECYHGGRNEQFMFGPCDEDNWRDHDLSSAYTTAMSLIGTVDWDSVAPLSDLEGLDFCDLAYALVDFEFPASVRFPVLPVRTANGIIFPRKGRSYACAPEIVLAQKLGASLSLKRGTSVTYDPGRPVFRSFIQKCIMERSKHPKGSFENLFWKEVGNSTYGKTAQGLRNKRVYELRSDDMVALPESKLTQPFFAAFITSYVRAVLGEVLNGFPHNVRVFSVTTDGFLSNATDQEIHAATSGPIFQSFSTARNRLDVGSAALEVKHDIRQPIGWRTRGSATLRPGSSKDTGIVLQKGGIKTNRLFDTEQDNSFIVNLFLNREAGQRIDYTIGLGLRVLVNTDSDFVSLAVSKRLNMEFDWKRRPESPVDRAFVFEDQHHTHLAFSTEPLENVEEFELVRDRWEKFESKTPIVLKTADQLRDFLDYVKLGKVSRGSISAYLSKKNGGQKRLRQMLCRAFKQRTAGFEDAGTTLGKNQNEVFAAKLSECGLECKVSDVQNGTKGEFAPQRVPITEETVRLFHEIRTRHFPRLDEAQYFYQAGSAR